MNTPKNELNLSAHISAFAEVASGSISITIFRRHTSGSRFWINFSELPKCPFLK
jgi:hypothetical protein